MKQKLIEFYLDWANNYLTTEKMSEHYNLPVDVTFSLIGIGRELHEANVKEIKLAKVYYSNFCIR